MKRAALVIAALLMLAGCSGGPSAGVVVDKGHTAQSEYIRMQYCGKGCFVPIPTVIPERWWLTVRDDEGHTGDISVNETTWDATSVGDYYGEDA